MTALLLATLLNLSPGIVLADNVSARHVALSEARLPLLFVSDDEDEKRPSIDAMTREQLAVELRRLDESRPSLVGPIVLMSVGAVLTFPGIGVFLVGVADLSSSSIVPYLLVGFGAIMITVGAILLLIGTIKLATRFGARRAHAEEVDEVQKRIDAIDQAMPPPPPGTPGPDIMPPPPPPPPQANLVTPARMQTVMTF